MILKLDFIEDGQNDSHLFDDSCFWNLDANKCDKRSPENSSTDCDMVHVELKQNAVEACKYSKYG